MPLSISLLLATALADY